MARQMVVLAFVFVAFVGLVSAADTAKAPAAATPQSSAASPDAGTSGTSPSSSPLADPMSPPSPNGESTVAGPTTAGAPTPGKSGATTLKVSSVVGVAVIAGFFVY